MRRRTSPINFPPWEVCRRLSCTLWQRPHALLKDAILKAADEAGGPEGLVGYLKRQAVENPGPFMSLLGKVLPLQMTGEPDEPLQIRWIESVIVDPANSRP